MPDSAIWSNHAQADAETVAWNQAREREWYNPHVPADLDT